MKHDWPIKTLETLCDSYNGLWTGKKTPFRYIGVIRAANFTKQCTLNLSDLTFIDVEERALATRTLQDGDIIIEKSGGGPKQPVGRTVIFHSQHDTISFCNFTSVLRIKNKQILLPQYLHSFLYLRYISGVTVQMQTNTTGLRNLDFTRYKGQELPVPPISEQERIVGILDKAFAKIDAVKRNSERNLQNAKELFQQSLAEAMEPKEGWTKKLLVDLCSEIIAGGDAPEKERYSSYQTQKYPIPIYANALTNDGLYGYTDIARIKNPSITIAARGSGTGHVEVRHEPFLPIVRLIVLVPLYNLITLKFLYWAMKNCIISHSGSAIPQLTVPMIKKYTLSHPNETREQNRIVEKLDSLSMRCQQMQDNYDKVCLNCDELKKAILTKAFNGEL